MIYLLLFVLWVLLMVCVLALVSINNVVDDDAPCTGDCRQGRDCTCAGDDDA